MATVRITGGTGDAGAIGDNRPWKLWAAVYQSDGTGGVITTRKDREANILRPVGGVLTFDVEAGIVVFLETPEGRRYSITTPETDGDLWALIEAAVAFPPETSQSALNAAVGGYVEANRAQFRTRAVPVDPEDPATLYQWVDENGAAVDEPVALSEIVNVGSGSIADASASGLAVLTGDAAAGREAIGAIQAADILAATKNVFTGKQEINAGFTNGFDTALWIAPAIRADPDINSQSLYIQHRLSGDLGGFVHCAGATELRLSNASNAGISQNAHEFSLVVTGGVNDISGASSVIANLHTSGTPTGNLGVLSLVRAQTVPALATGFTIDEIRGLYIEPQTVAATNYSIYAPDGSSVLGPVVAKDSTSPAVIARGRSDTVAGTELLAVQNSSPTTLFRVTSSGTGSIGGLITGCTWGINNNLVGGTIIGMRVQGHSAQSADLAQFRESGGTSHVRITAATSTLRSNLVVGPAAVATAATDGFVYLSSMAGAPSGTPTAYTGTVPIVIDSTNNKLMAYVGGSWKGVTLS